MNHNEAGGQENDIHRAKTIEVTTPALIDADMQRVLQKIREDSKQYCKLHGMR